MKTGSKRGAALAYVIVITAALLILAAGLLAAAKYNVDASQNGLESRQAYLDAKSAIEFGRAYLKTNPQSGTFSVLKTGTAAGFEIRPGAVNGAAALYDSTKKTINAAAKYQSSDRVRRLGYKLTGKQTSEGTLLSDFMLCGGIYGGNTVINTYYPSIDRVKFSDYPIVVLKELNIDANSPEVQKGITAPEIYLSNQDSSMRGYGTSRATMTSNFISISGNIFGQDYRTQMSDANASTSLILNAKDQNQGVLLFDRDIYLSIDGNQLNPDGSGRRSVLIQKGYYFFQNGMDLFNITESNKYRLLTKIEPSALPGFVSETRIQYVKGNFGKLYGGESNWGSNSAIWTEQGKLSEGRPSNHPGGVGYSLGDKYVYLYVNSCLNWADAFKQWDQPQLAVYMAKRIFMQYVNPSLNFQLPSNKTVLFRADQITLNTQKTDTELGGGTKPIITYEGVDADLPQDYYANFVLQSSNGTQDFYVNIPNDTTVRYSDPRAAMESPVYKRTYVVKQGIYHITEHIGTQTGDFSGIGVNLFSSAAERYFLDDANRQPYAGGGSGGGSGGGTTLSGGVYTDGQ